MKQIMLKYLTAIWLLMAAALLPLASQEIQVKAALDTGIVLAGDHVWFSVTVNQPQDIKLNLLRFNDTIVKNLEILRGPLTDTVRHKEGMLTIRDRYLLTSFDSGRYEIPPVYAEMTTTDGLRRFYSDYNYLMVNRVNITPPDSAMQFFDIIPPYRVPVTAGEILSWVLVALVASAIVVIIIWLLKRKMKNKTGPEPVEILEAAHVYAYRRLEKLRNEKLWQRKRFKEYYSGLSDILRSYMDLRFGLNTMESATSDILSHVAENGIIEGEAYDALRQVLGLADMVKFARLIPDSSDCELSLDQSWSFVSLTRKIKAEADGTDESISGEEPEKEEAEV